MVAVSTPVSLVQEYYLNTDILLAAGSRDRPALQGQRIMDRLAFRALIEMSVVLDSELSRGEI
jgi:hypothetical protein